jgi:hypothetical protein
LLHLGGFLDDGVGGKAGQHASDEGLDQLGGGGAEGAEDTSGVGGGEGVKGFGVEHGRAAERVCAWPSDGKGHIVLDGEGRSGGAAGLEGAELAGGGRRRKGAGEALLFLGRLRLAAYRKWANAGSVAERGLDGASAVVLCGGSEGEILGWVWRDALGGSILAIEEGLEHGFQVVIGVA